MSKGRIEALVDGAFAIIITLLVLEIKSPEVEAGNVFHAMLKLYPEFVAYFMSFIVVGIFWVSHHLMMHHISKVNRTFVWLNLFFIMLVSLIPFLSAIVGEHPEVKQALVLFSFMQVLAGLMNVCLWWYAVRQKLTDTGISRIVIKTVYIRNVISPIVYLLSIPVAYVNLDFAFIIFFSVPFVHIFPSMLDMRWMNKSNLHRVRTLGGLRK
jgi:uncharacterized membrane protein